MLTDVVEALVRDGWHVVLPCRRYSPIAEPGPRSGRLALRALRSRGRAAHVPRSGHAWWVQAQWDRPRELAGKAERALGGPADLLVAWVHEQYRRSVLGACEPLLAPDAPVVEVRGAGGTPDGPEPLLAAHPTQLVLFGSLSEFDDTRPLSHAELNDAIVDAVGRAVDGHPPSLHQAGQSRPVML